MILPNTYSIGTTQCLTCVSVLLNICSELDLDVNDIDEMLTLAEDDIGPTGGDIRGVLKMVAAYMQIAEKTTVHMVPKAITLYIIREVEKFITTDLLVQIVDTIDANEVSLFDCFFLLNCPPYNWNSIWNINQLILFF